MKQELECTRCGDSLTVLVCSTVRFVAATRIVNQWSVTTVPYIDWFMPMLNADQ
jgi:hypothetical protein